MGLSNTQLPASCVWRIAGRFTSTCWADSAERSLIRANIYVCSVFTSRHFHRADVQKDLRSVGDRGKDETLRRSRFKREPLLLWVTPDSRIINHYSSSRKSNSAKCDERMFRVSGLYIRVLSTIFMITATALKWKNVHMSVTSDDDTEVWTLDGSQQLKVFHL